MTSRQGDQLFTLRRSLEKAIESETFEEETLNDLFNALSGIAVDVDILKQTGIVQVLQATKKKYQDNQIGTKAKNMLAKWKRECMAGSDDSDKGTKKAAQPEVVKRPTVKELDANMKVIKKSVEPSMPAIARCRSEEDEWDDGGYYKNLLPVRQKITKLLSEQLQASGNVNIANFVATNVEASLHALHSAERDQKSYLNKAKSLTFNLKANQRLREDVLSSAIPGDVLVTLNAKELATEDLKGLREETTKNATMARRGDLYEITRGEILAANGIDPSKGGEFVCRKCKGNKTTHYALQTRSSDEPMTVFVCCLTCGNRWRTQ